MDQITSRARILLVLLLGFPMAVWLLTNDVPLFATGAGVARFFAKSAALIGMASYIIMPILSMRHPKLEQWFGSLDSLYATHKFVSKISILLLLLHPLFLLIASLVDSSVGEELWAWSSLIMWSGIVTLFAMLAVLTATLYAHVTHQEWVRVHRIFGWLIVPSIAHALLAGKVVAQEPLMLGYFLVLSALGFGAFLYRSVFSKSLVKRHEYVVSDVYEVEGDVTEVIIKSTEGKQLKHAPGQFAYVSFDSPYIDDEAHPYTIATAPNGPYLRFAIKSLGDYTSNIHRLKPGSKAYVEGPYGNFTRGVNTQQKQIWIAGGIGITPFLSVARSLSNQENLDIHLFYATNKIADAAFLSELFDIKRATKGNFQVTLVAEDISGFVDEEILVKNEPDYIEHVFFICGPPPMMKAMKKMLKKLGVKNKNVHTEEFSL